MKTARIIPVITAFVLFAGVSVAHAAEVRIKMQSRETFVGQPVRIDIQIVNANGKPTIEPPVVRDLQIIRQPGVSQSSQTFINNGVVSRESSSTYTYMATPNRAGRFTIPPFVVKVDGETFRTETQQFIAGKLSGEQADVLLVEVVGTREKLYVGEQLDVTLRIYIRPYSDRRLNVKLDEGDMWSLVDVNECAWGPFVDKIKTMYESRRRPSGREVLHADAEGVERAYYLYEISTDFWPMSPGKLNLGETRIKMDYPVRLSRDNSFFSMGNLRITQARPVSVAASVAPIEVSPLPEQGKPAIFRGAVGRFTISADATPTQVAVGEPITLDLVIRGTGRMETLEPPPLPDIRALTDTFKVPNDPLAGVVDGNAKRFSQSIRARKDDVTEIPPIPFAYFDPRREEYVVAQTNPIPIEVKAADVLSATQIVDAAEKQTGQPSRTLRELQSGILANYTGTEALLSQGAFELTLGTGLLLAGPPILVLGVYIVQRRRHRLRGDVAFARRRGAKRRALQALRATSDNADTTAMASVLTGYVADRCNLPPGGLTRSEVREHLRHGGVDTNVLDRVDSVLKRCEMSQFAGGGAGTVEELASTIEQCINALEKEAIKQ